MQINFRAEPNAFYTFVLLYGGENVRGSPYMFLTGELLDGSENFLNGKIYAKPEAIIELELPVTDDPGPAVTFDRVPKAENIVHEAKIVPEAEAIVHMEENIVHQVFDPLHQPAFPPT